MKPTPFLYLFLAALLLSGCGGSDSSDLTTVETETGSTSDDSSTGDTGSDDSSDDSDESDDDTADDSDDEAADDSASEETATESQCDDTSTAQMDELICATENFIATLTTTEQSAILYEWDNSNTERTIWSNLPTGNVQRNGMRIGELSDTAYDALITVAQTLLNDAGYEDFRGVLAADDYLQEQGGGSTYSSAN